MPRGNGNLEYLVTCPNCNEVRFTRGDVIKRNEKLGKPLYCKPCSNKLFPGVDPRKGTGVKHDPALEYTRRSFYKAKRRVKMGAKHHACYADVKFLFTNLQELIDCIGLRPDGMTLDRIDPLGNYEPGNVRWATVAEQVANRLPRNYWSKNVPYLPRDN